MDTKTWDVRRTVGALAVAAAIAGLGGTAIAAATDRGMHGMPGGIMHGGGGPPSPPASHRNGAEPQALHGENVVADGHGGFQTLIVQTGRVTAISATAITARSDDGFVQTYVIHDADGAAPPPFHVDDSVTIDATREGEAAVVTTVRPPL